MFSRGSPQAPSGRGDLEAAPGAGFLTVCLAPSLQHRGVRTLPCASSQHPRGEPCHWSLSPKASPKLSLRCIWNPKTVL